MSSSAVQRVRSAPRFGRGLAEAAVERARLTVVPRRRTRAARMPFVALVSLVLLGGVVGLLLFNTSMQQASFAATAYEQQASTLSARQQTLEMELDVLRDPQRVAQQAQKMGMVTAPPPAFLDLGSGKVVGDQQAATAVAPLRIYPKAPPFPGILDPDPVVTTVVADPPPEGVLPGTGGHGGGRDTGTGSAGNAGTGGTDGATGGNARGHRDGSGRR